MNQAASQTTDEPREQPTFPPLRTIEIQDTMTDFLRQDASVRPRVTHVIFVTKHADLRLILFLTADCSGRTRA